MFVGFGRFGVGGVRSVFRRADRAVAAIAEIVGAGPVRRGADMGRDVSTATPDVTAHALARICGAGVAIDITAAGPVVRRNVGTAAANIAAYRPGLGGEGGGEHHGGEGQFDQGFHGFVLVVVGVSF